MVRFARLLESPELLKLAHDLTEYGRRLGEEFQFKGEPPFAEPYASHGLFFDAQLGRRVDEALAYFRDVKVTKTGLSWHQTEMDRMGGVAPVPDEQRRITPTRLFILWAMASASALTPIVGSILFNFGLWWMVVVIVVAWA